MVLPLHVFAEAVYNALVIDETAVDAEPMIEQVAPFAALVKRPQLGVEQFIELKRRYFGFAVEPRISAAKRRRTKPSNVKCSRVLISILSRSGRTGGISDSNR